MCFALDMPCGARGDLDHIEFVKTKYRQGSIASHFAMLPELLCHPERLKKIADFRKESKDLRTDFYRCGFVPAKILRLAALAQDDILFFAPVVDICLCGIKPI